MSQPIYQYLISACLCGENCRYDGSAQTITPITQMVEQGIALSICPEQLGGLSTPRPPCECRGKQVLSQNGNDVTQAFLLGAQKVVALAKAHGITKAILKERSPSCGSHQVYDGTFTNTLINGQGITAQLLCQQGIQVLSSDHWIE